MTEKKYFGELALPETSPNMETAYAYARQVDNIHHRRVTRMFETDDKANLMKYTIRDFVDEDTPHANWGSGRHALDVEEAEIDQLIDALELARMG